MPPQIRKKIASAKKRIEKTPEAAKKEMAWYRSKPGELRPAVKSRAKAGVTLLPPLPIDKSMLHTHTYPSKALPSRWDLWQFIQSMKKSSIRTTHIAQLDKNGKVIGYTSIRATKKLVEWAKININLLMVTEGSCVLKCWAERLFVVRYTPNMMKKKLKWWF